MTDFNFEERRKGICYIENGSIYMQRNPIDI